MHRYRGAVAQPFAYASLLCAARFAAPDAVHVTLLAATPEAASELARRARAARAPAGAASLWSSRSSASTTIPRPLGSAESC